MQKTYNIFDTALNELRNYHFSLAFRLAVSGAREFHLYDQYKDDFANVRVLAFGQKDWALASEKLTILLRQLSGELTSDRA